MEPVRVLILIDRLGRGGVAQVALNVALTIDRTRFEPIICTTRDQPTYGHDEILRQAGITLIELKRRSRIQILSWKLLWQVLPTVTILHSHLSGSNFWGRIWGRIFRVPIIITQEHTIADEKNWVLHYSDRLLSPLSDKIVTVSQFDRERYLQYEKLPDDKVTSIYNGIDIDKFDCRLTKSEARWQIGLPEDNYIIGVVGRLAEQKNHRGFLRAMALLPPNLYRRVVAVFVGSGELEDDLRQEVTRAGLADKVLFLGERGDIPIILRALDLLALPSNWECLPTVLSEAMMSQCPVVATAVGGVPEIIGDVGWPIVEPKNPEQLAAAITAVYQMPETKRQEMCRNGRLRIIDKFSKEKSVAQVEGLYEKLLDTLSH